MRAWIILVTIMTATTLVAPTHAQQQTSATVQQQRADAALRVLTGALTHYASGTTTIDDVGTWAARWYQARRDTGLTGAPLIAAAQDWVDKMRAFEQTVKTRYAAGMANALEVDKAAFYRLDAESALAKLKTP